MFAADYKSFDPAATPAAEVRVVPSKHCYWKAAPGCIHRKYELKELRRLYLRNTAYILEPRRDIAGIILNRWGHAYLSPQPGFFFGKDGKPAPREILRSAPFGRIAFANTDLAGAMDHKTAISEAHRAVGQLLDQVLTT